MATPEPEAAAIATGPEVTVVVEAPAWYETMPVFISEVAALVRRIATLCHADVAALLHPHPQSARCADSGPVAPLPWPSIAVALVTDARMQTLNQRFRGRDKPTNVLAFPELLEADPGEPMPAPEAEATPAHLGDVVLALGVITREAQAASITPEVHSMHMLVHGVLHLLGYDHIVEEEAVIMEHKEREILSHLDLGPARPNSGGDGEAPTA